jgi:predicted nucleotidyltransferase
MEILKDFHPKLVGSVWRGTANRNSDIDIVVFSHGPKEIIDILRKNDFAIKRLEKQSVTKKGQAEASWHIHLSLPTGNVAEIVIRNLEEKNRLNRCEIYGDLITGIGYSQIRTFFDVDPFKKFLPKRR